MYRYTKHCMEGSATGVMGSPQLRGLSGGRLLKEADWKCTLGGARYKISDGIEYNAWEPRQLNNTENHSAPTSSSTTGISQSK